jgi:2'-hydroxyisoflavone reductase
MRLLILGGSRFVGRYLAAGAVAAGHQVTVFNRGRTGATVPGCAQWTGDRGTDDLAALADRRWDAVLDVCGYTVADVTRSATVLGPVTGHYCFVSTGAVYARMDQPLTEDSALLAPFRGAPSEAELVSSYAELKVACELALAELLGSALSIVRPGVLVGRGDYTDRLLYWVRRIAAGGEVLGPPRSAQPLQLLHARELASSVLRIVTDGRPVCRNLAGPEITFADLITACRQVSGSDATIVWGGPATLPLAVAADGSQDGGYRLRSIDGPAGRLPLPQICRELLDWDLARGRPELRRGIGVGGPERECTLIEELRAAGDQAGTNSSGIRSTTSGRTPT